MIKHIVMWNVRGATAEEKQRSACEIRQRFESLVGEIPGLLRLEVGIDISGASHACDVVLYSEFVDRQALSAYADHPAHRRIREELRDLRTERYQVDYETSKTES